jgi:NAD(P)-dependent dehydrogenase (short-subunit alcohol dehydrogenase family)
MPAGAALIDRILEASIVGSFSRIGHAVRRRTEHWDDHAGAGEGRSVLVTGANSGIGFATAEALLVRGARVVMTTRDEERGALARERLLTTTASRPGAPDRATLEDRLHGELLDLDHLASIRALAGRLEQYAPVDVVVHNAGAMFPERSTTGDGLERTWQVHGVGPFLLTMLLVPHLATQPDARVIWVASGGMYTERLVVERVDSPRGYRPSVAYARAKRAQVELVRELHRRLGERTGIAFHAMHPGWARTPGVASALPTFNRVVGPLLRTPVQGADTIVDLALAPRRGGPSDPSSGGAFWADRRPRTTDRLERTVTDDAERTRLWERLMQDSGIERPHGPV